MRIYDFLYFCFYCSVIKRPNDQSHVRAIFLLGVTLINFFTNIVLLFVLVFNIDLSNYKLYIPLLLLPYILISYLENKYYLDNGRYKLGIERFENRYSKRQKRVLGIFALFLFLLSVALFIWVGVALGMRLWTGNTVSKDLCELLAIQLHYKRAIRLNI